MTSPQPRLLARAAVAALGLLALPGCDAGPPDPDPPRGVDVSWEDGPPNIVFIVADTLRADHLGAYGYERETSPFVDSLARRGALFQEVKSQSPWTLPSMLSLFSGIGVLHFTPTPEREDIPDEVVFVGEILQEEGYRTYGICANPQLHPHNNFVQGFDRYEYVRSTDGAEINRLLLDEVRHDLDPQEPWFLWLHYMDPHSKYQPPRELVATLAPDTSPEPMHVVSSETSYLDEADLRRAVDLYDAEILYWDSLVAEVFEALGDDPDTLWVITSDHGEEFDDHGGLGHGISLYEELLRIPLILYNERVFPRPLVVEEPASAIDVLPTLLGLAGLRHRTADLEGVDLLAGGVPREPFVSHALIRRFEPRTTRTLRAIYRDDWKYIHDHTRGEHRLFDLATDPDEQVDELEDHPALARSLRDELMQYWKRHRDRFTFEESGPVDPETLQKLEELGY